MSVVVGFGVACRDGDVERPNVGIVRAVEEPYGALGGVIKVVFVAWKWWLWGRVERIGGGRGWNRAGGAGERRPNVDIVRAVENPDRAQKGVAVEVVVIAWKWWWWGRVVRIGGGRGRDVVLRMLNRAGGAGERALATSETDASVLGFATGGGAIFCSNPCKRRSGSWH